MIHIPHLLQRNSLQSGQRIDQCIEGMLMQHPSIHLNQIEIEVQILCKDDIPMDSLRY
jgi:hypothetical protein